MDPIVRLHLQVEQINRPENQILFDCFHINVTKSHTVHHLKEAIWIFSENHILKPVFLKIKHRGRDVNDLDILGEIDAEMTQSESSNWSLVIDYTLFNSPFIPNREPVPTLFDIRISGVVGPKDVDLTIQRSLDNLVGGIKEEIAGRLDISADEFHLLLASSHFDQLPSHSKIRDIIGLDVPPLHTVDFTIVSNTKVELLLHSLSGDSVRVTLDQNTTLWDLRNKIGQKIGKAPELVTLYNSTVLENEETISGSDDQLSTIFGTLLPHIIGSQIRYEITKSNEILLDGKLWHRTGNSKVELEDRTGNLTTVDEADIPGDYYTIEYGNETVKFTTSELIMNEVDSYVLLSPAGYAKLQRTWPRAKGLTNNDGIMGVQPTPTDEDSGDEREGGETADETLPGAAEVSPAESSGASENTQLHQAETQNQNQNQTQNQNLNQDQNLDHDQNPNQANGQPDFDIEEIVNALDPIFINGNGAVHAPNGNQSVAQRLFGVLLFNVQNIMQFGMQFVLVVMVLGFDIFREFLRPEVLAFVLCASAYLVLFIWGETVSEWLEQNILRNAPDQLDFRLVREVLKVFRFCTGVLNSVFQKQLALIKLVLPLLFKPRHEWLYLQVTGRASTLQKIGDYFNELVGTLVMFCATLLPLLQDGIEQYWLQVRNSEASNIWQATKAMLEQGGSGAERQQFVTFVELRLGREVKEYKEREEYELLLEQYVAVVRAQMEFAHVEFVPESKSEANVSGSSPDTVPVVVPDTVPEAIPTTDNETEPLARVSAEVNGT